MPVQINISGENAEQAIQEFSVLSAAFIRGGSPVGASVQPVAPVVPSTPSAQENMQPAAPAYQQPTAVPVAQPQQPMQLVPTQPQQPAQPLGAVPTAAAPAYTVEQLGVAAGPLLDAGRAGELTAWLNQKGVSFLNQLDPSLYGEFATYLRSLGAKI